MSDARIDAAAKAAHALGDHLHPWEEASEATRDDYRRAVTPASYSAMSYKTNLPKNRRSADEVEASECEKLRAALASLVGVIDRWTENGRVTADFDVIQNRAELDAARALVGSAPPNEADE